MFHRHHLLEKNTRIHLRGSTHVPVGRPRWWQWPTILSLDAPAVVLTWQALAARTVAAPLAIHHRFLLGASVWLAYSADRWIEAWRLSEATVRTQRHYFSIRWRWPIFVLWIATLGLSIVTAFHFFSPREWKAALTLLAPTLLYLLSHQFLHRHHPFRVPKEICVAALLTAGILIFPVLFSLGVATSAAVPGFLFFGLALANCLLISGWEREVDRAHHQTSIALRYRGSLPLSRLILLIVALFATPVMIFSSDGTRQAGLCAGASAFLLLGLSLKAPRWGRQLSRVLVDAALLTPLALFLFL